MPYYARLDVSLRSTHICDIADDGDLIAEGKSDSEVADIIALLDELDTEITVVGLEAGTLTQYMTYDLQLAGCQLVRMGARQINAVLSAMHNKTDKNDARGIAQLLRSGSYSCGHVKNIECHQVRALLSSHKAVLAKCTDLEQEILGLSKVFGIKRPACHGQGFFDPKVLPLIEADQALSQSLLPMLDARLVLCRTFRKLKDRVHSVARRDPTCQSLITAPGLGPTTALTYNAGIDDPTRSRRSRTAAGHFGLTPRRFRSGQHDFDDHISMACDANVRSMLYIAAANSMMTRNSQCSPLKA